MSDQEVSSELSPDIQRIDALIDEAFAVRAGPADRTIELASRVIEQSKEAGYETGIARATVIIAIAHFHAGRWEETIAMGRGIETAIRAGDRDWICHLVTILGAAAAHLGDIEQTGSLLLEALEIATELGDARMLAVAHGNISSYYLERNEYERAMHHATIATTLCTEVSDWSRLSRAQNTIARVHKQLGRAGEALDHYTKAVEASRQGEDPVVIATRLIGLAGFEVDLGLYREAIEHTQEALAICMEVGNDFHIGQALSLASVTYRCLGDLEKALDLGRQAFEVHQRMSYRAGESNHLSNIASILTLLGRYDEAIETHEAAIVSAEAHGRDATIADGLRGFGNTLRTVGRFNEAVLHLQRSVDIFTRIDHVGAVASMVSLAEVLIDQSLAKEAIDLLLRASAMVSDERLPIRSKIAQLLALAHRMRGVHELAYTYLTEHNQLETHLKRDEARRQLDASESRRELELSKRDAEIERLRNVELANAHMELQRAHDQLKHAQAQLVHAEKMASLGQLTAGIAHEINNPVNYILTSARPLRRDVDAIYDAMMTAAAEAMPERLADFEARVQSFEVDELRGEVESLLQGIEHGAQRTAEIVRGLRTFSRLDEDVTKPADLIEGIESTLSLLHSKLGSIEVHREYEELPLVDCHHGQINQVLMNILSNAIDAVSDGGTITIAARTMSKDSANCVSISIRDSGVGISPEHIEHLFEPFFTTKPIGSGQGLGLAIAHGIVENHHGSIDVETELGNGTAFTITLPVRSGSASRNDSTRSSTTDQSPQ